MSAKVRAVEAFQAVCFACGWDAGKSMTDEVEAQDWADDHNAVHHPEATR